MSEKVAIQKTSSDEAVLQEFAFFQGAEFLGLPSAPEIDMQQSGDAGQVIDPEPAMDIEAPDDEGEDQPPKAVAPDEAGDFEDSPDFVEVQPVIVDMVEPAPVASFFGDDPDPIETYLWKFYEPGGAVPAQSEIGLSPGNLVRLGEENQILRSGTSAPVRRLRLSPASRHWAPNRDFGRRDLALASMGLGHLAPVAQGNMQDVHVVIIDNGINQAYIEALGGVYAGGFSDAYLGTARDVPGMADPVYGDVRDHHGHMIARNVLSIAPFAKIYDCPLLPNRVTNMDSFVAVAENAFLAIEDYASRNPGNWVLVNAWALRERDDEIGPETDPVNDPHYTSNPSHPLNATITRMARRTFPEGGGFDIVFAAGNCGQFTTGRCGPFDRGPNQSIWGANALQDVLCVGASTAHDRWVGSSSQGPGPFYQGEGDESWARKPDVCAPSRFSENDDARTSNSGSSAACALAAGAVARLRSDPAWSHGQVSSEKMIRQLRANARGLDGIISDARSAADRWNNRLGAGLINLEGLAPDGVAM